MCRTELKVPGVKLQPSMEPVEEGTEGITSQATSNDRAVSLPFPMLQIETDQSSEPLSPIERKLALNEQLFQRQEEDDEAPHSADNKLFLMQAEAKDASSFPLSSLDAKESSSSYPAEEKEAEGFSMRSTIIRQRIAAASTDQILSEALHAYQQEKITA